MGDIILKEQSVALDEVVISGSNITQKVDRMVVVPTATAMKNSYNPYDLMLNLAIPHLKVDALGKGLEANGGSVQTRINGIVATSTDVYKRQIRMPCMCLSIPKATPSTN